MKKFSLAVVILTLCAAAFGQTATGTTPFKLVKAESITVSATQPSDMTMVGDLGDSTVPSFTITSKWNLAQTHLNKSVQVCATVVGVMAGTGSNTDSIAAGNVYLGDTNTPATVSNLGSGCGTTAVKITEHALANNAAMHNNSGVTDTAYVQVKNQPNIMPDTYTGTITVYAYVTP